MNRKYLVTLVTVLLLAAIALPVGAQTIWQTYGNVRAKQLNVLGATDLDTTLNVDGAVQIDGALNVDGATTFAGFSADSLIVSGNADVTGNLEVVDHLLTQEHLYLIPPAAITVTDGGIITPTGAVVELTAAGAVGAELAPAGDGQLLILINSANQTITISETTGARIAGDFAMGQFDTLTLIGQGVSWHEVARSNN